MCFVCLSLFDSGYGDNRLVFRGVRLWWGARGRRRGARGTGGWKRG